MASHSSGNKIDNGNQILSNNDIDASGAVKKIAAGKLGSKLSYKN